MIPCYANTEKYKQQIHSLSKWEFYTLLLILAFVACSLLYEPEHMTVAHKMLQSVTVIAAGARFGRGLAMLRTFQDAIDAIDAIVEKEKQK